MIIMRVKMKLKFPQLVMAREEIVKEKRTNGYVL